MNYFNIWKWGTGLLLGLLLVSCNDWLDVKPIDKILEGDLLEDEEGFATALNGIYLGMAGENVYGKELSCGYIDAMAQMYSIEQQLTGNSHRYLPFTKYEYDDKQAKGMLQSTWEEMYGLIANCNNLIEQAQERQEVFGTTSAFNAYVGELYALRAFLHFDVFRIWGPVYSESTKKDLCIPYYRKRTSLPEPLSTAEEVVKGVLTDLQLADSLLPQTRQNIKLDKIGVRALRARVYLYAGEKQKAYEEAMALIAPGGSASTVYYPFVTRSAVTDGGAPDRLFYSEQIFMLENSQRAELYEKMFDYMLSETQFLAPMESRIQTLFPGNVDIRYSFWMFQPGYGKQISFVKFAKVSDILRPARTRGQSMLKVSELYLIVAECAPDEQVRVDYLDKLWVGRGYQQGSVGDTEKKDWKKTIQTEYNREFYGEGQYFFYLKRNNVSSIRSGNADSDLRMGTAQYVVNLPESESKYR